MGVWRLIVDVLWRRAAYKHLNIMNCPDDAIARHLCISGAHLMPLFVLYAAGCWEQRAGGEGCTSSVIGEWSTWAAFKIGQHLVDKDNNVLRLEACTQ